ncbi:nitrous oxide reductase accessory protein NosL [Halostagnicola sp. A-GB9-2]|uniref:nitrous oxide reductase accessory protein NosL n=1 Tax=Halostagnicola sp. A-GB9-2 TaxID=3048066 RepID=UPI0024BF8714|nr:nitrous oxide reductase accessory protein NosL [Halostagnicola sp. A-GB9-2]MDJ1430644.1 nitrous oxide reductase accessory protein NosL [Halostagnicola sp. A-GB9-2]
MNRSDACSVSRRALVAVVAGTGFLAGCLDDEGDDGTNADDGSGSENGGEALELVDHPSDEPIDPPEGYNCPVCNMQPNDWQDWDAQLVHGEDGATFFDSPGCLFAYYADPTDPNHGGPDSEITGAWVSGFETGELTDAEDATFVLEHDHDRTTAPMDSPVPFADREDAVAYVEDYDDLSEDDIVGLDAASGEAEGMYP